MTTSDNLSERIRFEAWAAPRGADTTYDSDNGYVNPDTAIAFSAWQARAAEAANEQRKAFVAGALWFYEENEIGGMPPYYSPDAEREAERRYPDADGGKGGEG